MKIFVILYLANLILDYPLQGSFLAQEKARSNYFLFVHCAIWALGITIVLMWLGLFAWWKLGMLLAGHYVVDLLKCRRYFKVWGLNDMHALYLDQALHVVQIIICM